MSSQAGAPAGEVPLTVCPICLESWDNRGHLPKFLSCHHTVCLTCVTVMYEAHALTPRPAAQPTPTTTTTPPAWPLARIRGARQQQQQQQQQEEEEPESCTWVECPFCRTSTLVVDPATLQTNFYLPSTSFNRLVVWCEECWRVARSDCLHHNLTPLQHKMRHLTEEVQTLANEVYVWSCDRAVEYERQMSVYKWLCGLLRHAHDHMSTSLSQTQANQQTINHQTDHLQTLVKKCEALGGWQDGSEETIKELLQVADEVKAIHDGACGAPTAYPTPLGSGQTFRMTECPRGPRSYHGARIIMEANGDHLTLSFSSEEQPEGGAEGGGAGGGGGEAEGVARRREGGVGRRFHTLQGKGRDSGSSTPVRRAASVCHTPPRPAIVPSATHAPLDAPAARPQPQALIITTTTPPDMEPAKPAAAGAEWPQDTPSSDSDTTPSGRHTRADDGRGRRRVVGRNNARRRTPHPPHRSSKPKCCVV